ncbi:MAG: response regulator, partial [Burkholderiales bacterium]
PDAPDAAVAAAFEPAFHEATAPFQSLPGEVATPAVQQVASEAVDFDFDATFDGEPDIALGDEEPASTLTAPGLPEAVVEDRAPLAESVDMDAVRADAATAVPQSVDFPVDDTPAVDIDHVLEDVQAQAAEPEAVAERSSELPATPGPEPAVDAPATADANSLLPGGASALPEEMAASLGGVATSPPIAAIAPNAAESLSAADLRSRGFDPAERLLERIQDEIDPQLLPIFLEEAAELVPLLGQQLRAWEAAPANAGNSQGLQRTLHTLKGSARMAGAMAIGQVTHSMESRVEGALDLQSIPSAIFEGLVASYDRVNSLLDGLRSGAVESVTFPTDEATVDETVEDAVDDLAGVPDAVPQDTLVADEAAGAAESLAIAPVNPVEPELPPVRHALQAPATPAPAAPVAEESRRALLRVRADLVDRLVNEAGEVSIARARLENEMGVLRQSLGELTENVNRLRTQLREIELAADSRIDARNERDRELDRQFDALEFDRYTRFQELTRMLAESVNDVATVQQNALRSLDEAGRDLARQTQVTRDLQQDLMRIRMVQFGSIADRLYRVVRQSAKELDKRVALDLRGASAELDRGVLERMAGPIEHLLRNAVAHGIESRAERQAAGKAETGEIVLEVRQEGNEVILSFADDGAGLNYTRIRQRAIERRLIAPDAHPGERELGDLIFMPGFSTATEVTAIAGRGVGMDVVRAEVAAMGGRIDLESVPGRGTRFTVHLPVSLAVAQVVLLTVGPMRIAVTSALIEQVMQLKPEALASAYGRHAVDWHGQPVPLYYLGSLLELPECTPLAQRYSPVVIVRSGAQRIALHVDHVAPSQEVVVKHVGPQLARLTGMAGATVLGNGDIVLILNPVQIAATGRGAHAGEGDTAGFAPTRIEIAPTVMVVDDSVTVRKVTQRLLAREGYQVMLAKDGLDALRQLQDAVPDVMLLDIEMPRMDGFELTKNIRSDERWKALPIVMITSRTADKHRDHAMSLGVDAFLGKPYDEDELLRLVAAFAQRRQQAG